ncbi:MAG: peptidoglycan-associated lipoprotein Pal [Candidatus Methylomirabilales bacterium]
MTTKARELRRKRVGPSRNIWRGSVLVSVLFLGVALLLTGCPKKPEVQTGGIAAAPEEPVARPEPIPEPPMVIVEEQEEVVVVEEFELKDVFFDFDKSVIRSDAREALDQNVDVLNANSDVSILVEGHCDERGTNEYNLALGERRAKAVRDYLVAGGIDSNRISTISYGEERPFVLGHDESAWKWNRRGHFVAQ